MSLYSDPVDTSIELKMECLTEHCKVCHGLVQVENSFDVSYPVADTELTIGDLVQKVLKPSLASWKEIQGQYLCEQCIFFLVAYQHEETALAKRRAKFLSTYKVGCDYNSVPYIENGAVEIGCQTDNELEDFKKPISKQVEHKECQTELTVDVPLVIKEEDDENVPLETRRERKSRSKMKIKVLPKRRKKKVEDSDEASTEGSDIEENARGDPDFADFENIGKSEAEVEPSPVEKKSEFRGTRKTRRKHHCKYCSKEFRRPGEVANHVQVVHMKNNPNQCIYCQKKFNSRNGLYVHLKRVHNMEYSQRIALVSQLDEEVEERDLKDVPCLDLKPSSPLNSDLEEAEDNDGADSDWTEETDHKSNPSRLSLLSRDLKEKENLSDSEHRTSRTESHNKQRSKRVESVKFLSEDVIGDEEFGEEKHEERKKKAKKKRRIRSRVGERFTMPLIHECPTCGKKWRTVSELNAHIQTHSDLRPWVCEICGQGYKMRKALLVHVGMHKGVHPFTCNYCNKSFTQKVGLVKHMNIHENVKKFTCDLCGKSFIHRSSYNFHKLVHTGERLAKCSICNVALLSKSHLNRHMLVHTGEKPHECNICGKRFAKKWNRDVHMKKLHGANPCSSNDMIDPSEGPVVDIRNTAVPIEKIGLVVGSTTPAQIAQDVKQIGQDASPVRDLKLPVEPPLLPTDRFIVYTGQYDQYGM